MPSSGQTRQVFVTGAGFTRAFLPDAPLLVDDFGNDDLVETVRGLPMASQILEAERNQHADGFINIERLMTRLHQLMPYDHSYGAVDEYSFLLAELRRAFLRRITNAMESAKVEGDVLTFARHCAGSQATCVTFNYDDFLDAALSTTANWNPHWGYGFFCRAAAHAVSDILPPGQNASELQILKLHGSINWWPLLGYSEPYALDAIVHLQSWEGISRHLYRPEVFARHLGPDPFIVPPVLSKSQLVAQPILRLTWTLAFECLSTANSVTFIGYSLPLTDMAARVLFAEALRDLPPEAIQVVDAKPESDREAFKARYRQVLGAIPDRNFLFEGAGPWARRLPIRD